MKEWSYIEMWEWGEEPKWLEASLMNQVTVSSEGMVTLNVDEGEGEEEEETSHSLGAGSAW